MKNKKILFFVCLSIIIILLTSCVNPFLPIYERIDKDGSLDDDGIILLVEGVRYQMLPLTKWSVLPGGDLIGYAGSWKTTVSEGALDTERNFVFLHDFGTDVYYAPLYRTDRIIPEPSADSVDELYYSENDFRGEEPKRLGKIITDKTIIKELFDAWDNGIKSPNKENIIDFGMDISCYSSEVPGADYTFYIEKEEDKFVFGTLEEGYTEMPVDLLEKIAGHEINVDMLLS